MPMANISAAVTIGDQDNINYCKRHGVDHVEVANEPLGAKHNSALALALTKDWDALIVLPSDDFIDARYMALAAAAIDGGAEYVVPRSCALYDKATGRSCLLSQREPVVGNLSFGAGRVLSRGLVERIGDELWTPHKGRGLDTDSNARIIANGGRATLVGLGDGIPCLTDIKTDVNLWAYDKWASRAIYLSADVALGMIGMELQDGIIGRKNARR